MTIFSKNLGGALAPLASLATPMNISHKVSNKLGPLLRYRLNLLRTPCQNFLKDPPTGIKSWSQSPEFTFSHLRTFYRDGRPLLITKKIQSKTMHCCAPKALWNTKNIGHRMLLKLSRHQDRPQQ